MKSHGQAVSASSMLHWEHFEWFDPTCSRATLTLSDCVCMLKVKFSVFAVLNCTQSLASPVTSVGHWFLQVTFLTDSEIDLPVLGLLAYERVCSGCN